MNMKVKLSLFVLSIFGLSSCCKQITPTQTVSRDTVTVERVDTILVFGFPEDYVFESPEELPDNVEIKSTAVNPGAVLTKGKGKYQIKIPGDTVKIVVERVDTVFNNNFFTRTPEDETLIQSLTEKVQKLQRNVSSWRAVSFTTIGIIVLIIAAAIYFMARLVKRT